MNKIEEFWNIVHYFVYKADYKCHLLYMKIDPLTNWICKLPVIKRYFAKKGIDVVAEVNKAIGDPYIGMSSRISRGCMIAMVGYFCFGLVFTYCGIIQNLMALKIHLIVIIVVSLLVNYFLLFRNDRYIKYFKRFNKKPRKWEKKWAWISLGVGLGVLIFLVGSFVFMDYRLHH